MMAARFAVAVAFFLGAQLVLAQEGDANAGKANYDRQCSTCHGTDGTAKEAVAKMLKVEIPHLGSPEVQTKSDADLQKMIVEGVGKMRPQKMSEKDAASVVAHLRTLKQ